MRSLFVLQAFYIGVCSVHEYPGIHACVACVGQVEAAEIIIAGSIAAAIKQDRPLLEQYVANWHRNADSCFGLGVMA